MGRACAYVGSDSFVARHRSVKMRGAAFLQGCNRILRRLFWFRSWCRTNQAIFWVPSALNPADSPSRVCEFDSGHGMLLDAQCRFNNRVEACPEPFFFSSVRDFLW